VLSLSADCPEERFWSFHSVHEGVCEIRLLTFWPPLSHLRFAALAPFPQSRYASNSGTSNDHQIECKGLANTTKNDIFAIDNRIIAFFKKKEDAYKAISELRQSGFTTDQIGLMTGDEYQSTAGEGTRAKHDESFWDKVKDFFTGESHEAEDIDYRETSSRWNWDTNRADYYYNGINAGGALVSVTGSRIVEAQRILENAGGDLRESGFEAISTSTGAGSEEVRRIQLRGEMLRTYKERVQRDEVRLRKEVVSENKTVQVPVTREELVVERVPASGQAAPGEIGTDQEIRVPLSEERVRAEKQPVVTGEVRVGKRTVQNTETVSENVRHEELRADKDGDVEIDTKGSETAKRKKPAA